MKLRKFWAIGARTWVAPPPTRPANELVLSKIGLERNNMEIL